MRKRKGKSEQGPVAKSKALGTGLSRDFKKNSDSGFPSLYGALPPPPSVDMQSG
jgi:hypothetical protein